MGEEEIGVLPVLLAASLSLVLPWFVLRIAARMCSSRSFPPLFF
jgi:hypothetical protein